VILTVITLTWRETLYKGARSASFNNVTRLRGTFRVTMWRCERTGHKSAWVALSGSVSTSLICNTRIPGGHVVPHLFIRIRVYSRINDVASNTDMISPSCRAGCWSSGNALDSSSGNSRFKSRQGHLLLWLFLCPLKQIPGWYLG
jgi:hypothetical protein